MRIIESLELEETSEGHLVQTWNMQIGQAYSVKSMFGGLVFKPVFAAGKSS